MNDSHDPLAFEPVPTAKRHDGWTPERQRAFIELLAIFGVVTAAARGVGMSSQSAYNLLKRAGPDSSFAAAWRFAQGEGRRRAFDIAVERGLKGVATPIFYGGRQIGERRRFNDGLVIAALRFANPEARKPGRDPWLD